MKNPIPKLAARLAACAALAFASQTATAQPVLFSDDFAVNSSANWSVFANSADYQAKFAFAYTTNKFVRGGVTNTIPLAPSSPSSSETNGLKLAVNDSLATIVAVNLYPAGQAFSNNYALKFDMWLNYTGAGFGTGTGGTEDAIFGINHVGDKNVYRASASSFSPVGDGISFAVDTDGDIATQDYFAYAGDNINPLVELQGFNGGFLDRDLDGNPEVASDGGLPATYPLKLMFPSPAFESAGMPSKQWVRVELRQRTNDLGEYVITWLIDGYVIAEHNQALTYGQTNGNVMIGMMDPFSGVGTPIQDSFMIYDNVRVVDLNGFPANQVVSITAPDPSATENSADDGLVTITRTGSTASSLTVPIRIAGTATRGSDYVTQTNGVTFSGTNVVIPAGSSSVDIVIHTLDDSIGESIETAVIALVGNPNAYDVRDAMFGKVDIADDGDKPVASISRFRPGAYEGNTNSYGLFLITFSTPFNQGDVTVNYTVSGTAVNGTHYENIGSSLVMPAGVTTNSIYILPIQNTDTVSNRIVTVTLTGGTDYFLSTNATATNASIIIYNDDLPPATGTLFSDNFETDSSPNWNVNASASVCDAVFAFDYSILGIPPAPHSTGGTTLGLKMRANSPLLGSATFSGISVSPKDQNFTNDFRLRYDLWLNFPGAFPGGGSGSTQLGTAGITSGNRPLWPGGALSPQDSVMFAIDGDGGTTPDVRVYTNGSAVFPVGSGVYSAGTQASAGNTEDAYYAMFGRLAAPQGQIDAGYPQTGLTAPGAPGMVWHDVVITKLGSTLTWTIDGVSIATINATRYGYTLSTNIFVGHSDINSGQTTIQLDAVHFGLVDNLVVESLPAPTIPVITNIAIVAGTSVAVDFAGAASRLLKYGRILDHAILHG